MAALPAPFHLRIGPLGIEQAIVDGNDITDACVGLELRAAEHQPTYLTVFTSAPGDIEGTGIVQAAPDDGDSQAAIVAFLDGIDPQQLEAAALMNADASRPLTATMLDTLRTWAAGGTP